MWVNARAYTVPRRATSLTYLFSRPTRADRPLKFGKGIGEGIWTLRSMSSTYMSWRIWRFRLREYTSKYSRDTSSMITALGHRVSIARASISYNIGMS